MIYKNFHLGWYRSVCDIKSTDYMAVMSGANNATNWRSKVNVLVVDDKDFPFATSLREKGFRIQYEKDIDLAVAGDYDLILCDQYGVGKKLNSEAEGGSLACAIKKRYPLKYVVLYTSQSKLGGFDKGFKILDDVVYAGMDDDDFETKMDKWCRICLDPIAQWKRLRTYLLDSGVGIGVVAELESDFVKQYLKKGTYTLPKPSSGISAIVWEKVVSPSLTKFAEVVTTQLVSAGIKAAACGL